VPERTLTTWLVVDVSPSMAFGTAERLKSDVAEGVAQVVGRLAVRRAGRVALMTFGDGRPRLLPPRAARPGIVAVRRALTRACADGSADPAAMSTAFVRLAKVARRRSRGDRVRLPRSARLDLRSARNFTVLAVEVRDPREGTLPNTGQLALVDPVRRADPGGRVAAAVAPASRSSRPRIARVARELRVCGSSTLW
jgi:uncharacterized protein (DUF58 family)